MKVKLAGKIGSSISNGEGLRKVLFAQGCRHNCKGCFNPETHDFNGGVDVDCQELIDEINNDYMIDGVTFSGGDPFEQADAFAYIAENIKVPIWCYTGYKLCDILDGIQNHGRDDWYRLLIKTKVLVDGKFDCDKMGDFKYKGSSNQYIIDVERSILNQKIVQYTHFIE